MAKVALLKLQYSSIWHR